MKLKEIICKIFGHNFFCIYAEKKENTIYVELWCLRCSHFRWDEDNYDWSKMRLKKTE